MSSVDEAAAAYVVANVGTPLMVARAALSSLDIMEMVRAAFIAGVHHDASVGRAMRIDGNGCEPRAMVRARPGFLRDPDAALVMRGRQLVPMPGRSPTQMMVEIDARRGISDVVSVFIEGRELSRMVTDLYTLCVWNPETEVAR